MTLGISNGFQLQNYVENIGNKNLKITALHISVKMLLETMGTSTEKRMGQHVIIFDVLV